jgi:uncharacterized membrane protein YciS (DUF1049 family)
MLEEIKTRLFESLAKIDWLGIAVLAAGILAIGLLYKLYLWIKVRAKPYSLEDDIERMKEQGEAEE